MCATYTHDCSYCLGVWVRAKLIRTLSSVISNVIYGKRECLKGNGWSRFFFASLRCYGSLFQMFLLFFFLLAQIFLDYYSSPIKCKVESANNNFLMYT